MALHALAQYTARLLLAYQQKQQGRQQCAGIGSRDGEEEGVREDWSVYCALADLGMEERVKGVESRELYTVGRCVCVCVLHAPSQVSTHSHTLLSLLLSRLHGVEPDRTTWQAAHRSFTQAFVAP